MIDIAKIFVERQRYANNDYSVLLDFTDISNKFIKTDGQNFEFIVTGFLIVDDMPIIIFPKNYKTAAESEEIKSDVMLLLKVIMKYRLEKFHNAEEITLLFGNEKFSTGKIVSSIAIIEDYLQNGYIKRNTISYAENRMGFTDWHKTVNQSIPTLSHGNPVYLLPVKRNNVEDVENVLTKIHKWVINECLRVWGWLYGDDEKRMPEKSPFTVDKMMDVLTFEETRIYVDREIFLVRNLLIYLKACKGRKEQLTYDLLVTPYFNLVWESICGFVYSNDYNRLSKWVAQPVWEGPHVSKKISQKPDILFIEKNTFYILDAKYYDYKFTIPGWQDVVKQLFYKYTIEKKIQNDGRLKKINSYENVLIFPENSEKDFTYLGKVYVDGVMDLGEVKAFAINTRKAMMAYSDGERKGFKEELILSIENVNNEPEALKKRVMAYE